MIRFDVAVVGGGPAGLSAALAASAAGASVALFDEQTEPGGELRYRLRHRPRDGDPTPVPASRTLARLLDRIAATSVEPRLGAVAWGLFPGNVLSVVDGSRGEEVAAGAIVLATGSTDAALPFPGGSLPGVWSGRAILILLNRHRVRPGRRFALVGGAETEEVAESIRLAGGEVVLVAPRGASIAAEGAAGVRAIAVDGRRTEVDAVVVAAGRHPDAALAQIAGAPLGFDAALGGWLPVVDDGLGLPPQPLFVAGNAAGICDVATALAEGTLAGWSAAAALGLVDAAWVEAETGAVRAVLSARFAARRRVCAAFAQAYR